MLENPTVVFAPGAWCEPDSYDTVRNILKQKGYPTVAVAHPSINSPTPGITTLADDAASLASTLRSLADEGKQILLAVHSYGGCVGSCAVEGLDIESRRKQGKKGGIIMLMYITAFVLPKGRSLKDGLGGNFVEWMVFDDKVCRPSPATDDSFYFDCPTHYLTRADGSSTTISASTTSRMVFSGPVTYEPWRDIPTAYFVCDGDNAIPVEIQRGMVEMMKDGALVQPLVTEVNSSHFPMWSVPEKLVEAVVEAVGKGVQQAAIRN
ncbi:Alpha/beta hydrolase fold-1 [Pyronema omphalodes]|nr:Alpha/beta hydrolase fold-1 [Pyronema omphalodes]